MSYSPKRDDELINAEEKRLNRDLSICSEVRQTVNSNGWKDTIGPLIDRMIIDTCGGKIGDVWVAGKLERARKDERREFYIGYKQALIDLHNRVMFHLSQVDLIEGQLKQRQKDKQRKYRVPLVDDTRYRPEE